MNNVYCCQKYSKILNETRNETKKKNEKKIKKIKNRQSADFKLFIPF
jgi:hypothetical protein